MTPRKPRVFVVWFPGVNCHWETMYPFQRLGAQPELVLYSELLAGTKKLDECDILVFAGGFSFGDDIAAGRIMAMELTRRFGDQLRRVKEKKIPTIGICNGFQILVETGLLPGDGQIGHPTAVLDHNLSSRFEHRHGVDVVLHESKAGCIWTKGLDGLTIKMPSAHGQGQLILPSGSDSYNIMATYGTYDGMADYCASPNGSHIAGLCTTEIAGLMPHPERAGDAGLAIFEAGINAVR